MGRIFDDIGLVLGWAGASEKGKYWVSWVGSLFK